MPSLGVPDLGEAVFDFAVSVPLPSSSSSPNDNFGVPTFRFFFFEGGWLGVDALYYSH